MPRGESYRGIMSQEPTALIVDLTSIRLRKALEEDDPAKAARILLRQSKRVREDAEKILLDLSVGRGNWRSP